MNSEKRWVTMADVARAANVSKITVSRALRSPERVKPATRERVLHAAQELGYVPDSAAGALASGGNRLVAAVISTLDGSLFGRTIEGLSQNLRANSYQLLLGTTEYSEVSEADLVSTILGHHPDGVVLTSSEHTAETVTRLRAMQTAIVEIWELPEDPIDIAVGFSNVDAGFAMTKFLHDVGRRHLAYIGGGPKADLRNRLRHKGFMKACKALGLREPPVVPYDRTVPSASVRGATGMRWILQNMPDVDAVFCTSDEVAVGAIGEAQRCGKDVPGDIAIAGKGDFEVGSQVGLGITTIRVPEFEIGETAARLILERKQGAPKEPKVVDLGFEIVRRSTA